MRPVQGSRIIPKTLPKVCCVYALYSEGKMIELFDWATETTLAKMGTEEQKASIRSLVVSVKEDVLR
ncbi:MAG TPA: hypothetical protein VN666_21790 [Nitrospira sp.]|nr:hypothetical protein [Nitrospira sp.]